MADLASSHNQPMTFGTFAYTVSEADEPKSTRVPAAGDCPTTTPTLPQLEVRVAALRLAAALGQESPTTSGITALMVRAMVEPRKAGRVEIDWLYTTPMVCEHWPTRLI